MKIAPVAAAALLFLAPLTLRAATTINLPLSASGQANSTDEVNFFINQPADPVYTVWDPAGSPIKEQRGILEFDLASLPAGATIESAELLFDVASFNSRSNGGTTLYPFVSFYTYAGNNAIDVADADPLGPAIGSATVNDTGPWSIPLHVESLQTLIDNGAAAIGILTYANSEALPVGIQTSSATPAISLTYSLSPSLVGDTNNDGVVDLVDLNNVLNNFGDTGTSPGDENGDGTVDLADLNNVLNNFGDTAPTGVLAIVPEPSALAGLFATLPLLSRRRPTRRA